MRDFKKPNDKFMFSDSFYISERFKKINLIVSVNFIMKYKKKTKNIGQTKITENINFI